MNLVLDNIVFSLQRSGGISIVWEQLIKGVQADPSVSPLYLEYPSDNIFRNGLDIAPGQIVTGSLGPMNYRRYLSPRIDRGGEPFVFHSSYYRTVGNREAKNITTVHDFTYDYFSSGIKKRIHCAQKYRAILNSDVIVCISENTRRDLLKFVPEADPARIKVIYNGVADDYHPLAEVPYPELADHLIFVGARGGYKNFRFAAEAIAPTRFKLLICGAPLDLAEKSMLDTVLGHDRYTVKVRPSNAELNRLYNSVYALVYPSSYEGFGIPVIEAQRAKCPAIAVNASSIPEVIGKGGLMIGPELSAKELRHALDRLSSPGLRDELAEAGIENAARFSWDKAVADYLEIYHSL